jgi:hypothetical protein
MNGTVENYAGIESATPFLGRCGAEGCEFVLFSTNVASADRFRDVKANGSAHRMGDGRMFGRCPDGHFPFRMKAVKGTYSPDHKCDARCLNAKGHDCTCSCGGMNHGRGHAVAVTNGAEVTAKPTAKPISTPEDVHLGEVGQSITGEVEVISIKPISDAVLFTFRATQKPATLKWFAPSYAVPEWEVGQTLTIRGKVKSHDDHERFGKSTRLTYVEEK